MSSAAAAAAQVTPPPIAEIRVHGNHSTPDAEVIAASGLTVGQPSGDDTLQAAAERLRASGRFRSVEVHRRGRSIDDPNDVLVLILIEELPGATPELPTPGWLRRTTSGVMWLPVLSYTEGYGVTYGLRLAAVDLLGPKSQVVGAADLGRRASGRRDARAVVRTRAVHPRARRFRRPPDRASGLRSRRATRRRRPSGRPRRHLVASARRVGAGRGRAVRRRDVARRHLRRRPHRRHAARSGLSAQRRLDHRRAGRRRCRIDDPPPRTASTPTAPSGCFASRR